MASWWFAKDDTENTFTDTSWAEQLTLDFTAPAQGDYLIMVSCALRSSSVTNWVYTRAQLDDTTWVMEGQYETHDVNLDYQVFSAVYLAENLGSGSHSVDIDTQVMGSTTGYIRYMKIVVIRLDDWLPTTGMYDYAATESVEAVTITLETVQTLTFTPDQAGDYLILGSCELDSNSTSKSIDVRLNYDSGSEYLPVNNNGYVCYENEDGNDYMCAVWGGIVSLPASSKTILMEAYSTNTSNAYVRKRRIFAVRIGAMDSSATTDEDPSYTTTTSQWTDRSVITFTPASTEDYLIIAGSVIYPTSPGSTNSGHGRLEQTAGTGTGTISLHDIVSGDASGYGDQTPLFTVEIKSLTNVSQTFKTQWGYRASSGTIGNKGSFIVAIRKPASETTDYHDIGYKTSLWSADTFKDMATKVSLWSADNYKDMTTKASLLSADTYLDLATKVSLWSADTYHDMVTKVSIVAVDYKDLTTKASLLSADSYKDMATKVSLLSADTYKDMATKASLWSATQYHDIGFKVSLDTPYSFKDMATKVSLWSADTFLDLATKVSLWSADTFKDMATKVSLWSADTYHDMGFKVSISSLDNYKDLVTKVSLKSADTFKDMATKVSLSSAPQYKDLATKISLLSADTFLDLATKVSLWSADTFLDLATKVSLSSAPQYKDLTTKVSLLSADTYLDLSVKVSIQGAYYKDMALKVSIIPPTGYKDIGIKVTIRKLLIPEGDIAVSHRKNLSINVDFLKKGHINISTRKVNNIRIAFRKVD